MLLFFSCLCHSVCAPGKLGYGFTQDYSFLLLLRNNAAQLTEIKRKTNNTEELKPAPSGWVIGFKLNDPFTLLGIEFHCWVAGWKHRGLANKGGRGYSLSFLMDLIACKRSYCLPLFYHSTIRDGEKIDLIPLRAHLWFCLQFLWHIARILLLVLSSMLCFCLQY